MTSLAALGVLKTILWDSLAVFWCFMVSGGSCLGAGGIRRPGAMIVPQNENTVMVSRMMQASSQVHINMMLYGAKSVRHKTTEAAVHMGKVRRPGRM